jgi:hypothetical protein
MFQKIYFLVDIQIQLSLILLFAVNILFTCERRGLYLFDLVRKAALEQSGAAFAIEMTDSFYEETRT